MNVEGGVEEGNVSMAQKSQQPSNCGDEDPLYPHGIQRVPLGISAADILRRLGDSPDVIKVSALTMPSAFVAPCSITYELDGTDIYSYLLLRREQYLDCVACVSLCWFVHTCLGTYAHAHLHI